MFSSKISPGVSGGVHKNLFVLKHVIGALDRYWIVEPRRDRPSVTAVAGVVQIYIYHGF